VQITFPGSGKPFCLGVLPPAQLNVALLHGWPSLLAQAQLLSF